MQRQPSLPQSLLVYTTGSRGGFDFGSSNLNREPRPLGLLTINHAHQTYLFVV